ncbi:uncharacterized protein BP5553_01214 [Venustampulla echinocandica]|uniref:SET domain-containing protein n=1 Tax=Venustampulla echinocandica TaxID=2656787 RepID=A0A370U0E2_9HELO|nr:uncharacterized protein BP5553_01214 [Venustampulla echinocandica]RDL41235.1 hypothetical protein BP5553_01214 [Venustampulla echinocandica]
MVLDQPKIDALLQWAEVNHTSLHPHVEIYQDPVTGLSFRAVEDIPSGDKLVNCSYHTALSYLNAIHGSAQFHLHESPRFPREFLDELGHDDPHIIGHFFLIQQYLMGAESFWWDYIRLLPQPDQPKDMGLPIWWPEADRKFLAGTNAEPPIRLRQRVWRDQWKQGINLLENRWENLEAYTYILYKWAATIFGTRSFRASLTIPEEMIGSSYPSVQERVEILDHIKKDRFSVLLPVLDIGNHDGLDFVKWSKAPETEQFILSTSKEVTQGAQIYNFYGHKSNSELLVGYGFTIPPTMYQDVVNLKLTPTSDATQLRRSQTCHRRPRPDQTTGEFMFRMRYQTSPGKHTGTIFGLKYFSHGLFETMVCMVANSRERRFIQENLGYCLERDSDMFSKPLYRAVSRVLPILSAKLESEIGRIRDSEAELGNPQNENQKLALDYRNRQLGVLETALAPIIHQIHEASSLSSFCQHPRHQASPPHPDYAHITDIQANLLSLECAFDWLHIYYPDIHDSLVRIIADDQEEHLPLNWSILVEDWDNAYWIVWIYLIWKLWALDRQAFELRHGNLRSWLPEMTLAYNYESFREGGQCGDFYSDPSEHETINHTIQQIDLLPQFSAIHNPENLSWEKLRNFASLIALEETIPATFNMDHGGSIEQKVLVLPASKRNKAFPGPWPLNRRA